MKKNIYYSEVVIRKNLVKSNLLNWLFALSSLLRVPVEVFLRKNFGERYFSRLLVSFFAIAFLVVPYVLSRRFGQTNWDFLFENFSTWYIYTFAFIFFSYKRYQEVKRNPSVFDFSRFSQYEGDINETFLKWQKEGRANIRTIEIYYESGAVFLAGLILFICKQPIALVLLVCSVMYWLSYSIAYLIGDHFIMDKIDQMIMNEEMEEVFVNDKPSGSARGVRFTMKKPDNPVFRQKLMDSFIIDDKDDDEDDDGGAVVAS